MDNFYILVQKLSSYMAGHDLMGIPHCGFTSGGRFANPPKEHLEIVYRTQGKTSGLMVGDLAVELPSGHVSFHNVHYGNYSEQVEKVGGWCVFFDIAGIEELKELGARPIFSCMEVVDAKRLEMVFKTLLRRCQQLGRAHDGYLSGHLMYDPRGEERDGVGSRGLLIRAAVLELMGVLLENAQAIGRHKPAQHLVMIRGAMDYMAERMSRASLTLGDMAGEVGLSEDYFGMLFKEHAGMTPIQYLTTLRVNQAKLLLRQTDLTVQEIAGEVGFGDPLYFSRVFRKYAGVSPRGFRCGG